MRVSFAVNHAREQLALTLCTPIEEVHTVNRYLVMGDGL